MEKNTPTKWLAVFFDVVVLLYSLHANMTFFFNVLHILKLYVMCVCGWGGGLWGKHFEFYWDTFSWSYLFLKTSQWHHL